MSGRLALWRTAAVLSEAVGAELSLRARRLAVAGQRPVSLDDVRDAPDWATADPQVRGRLVRLTGAAASAHAWRRTLDGPTLRRVGDAVGEPALDALLALPDVMTPAASDPAAATGDPTALEHLGAGLLLGEGCHPPAVEARLRGLLGLPAEAGRGTDPQVAAVARRTAEGLLAQLGASGAEAS